MTNQTRRTILLSPFTLALLPTLSTAAAEQSSGSSGDKASLNPEFPTQDPELVKQMVAAAHGNFPKVKELVGRNQTLAKATYDWGFGDWETALGGASHVGNREIAEFLLAKGARPTLFSAAMLGQLDVVKAFVAASPGVQRIKGPHSITLLRHAMAGGAAAKPVVEYLTDIGGADERIAQKPLTAADREKLAGAYLFGAGSSDKLDVIVSQENLQVGRPGRSARALMHLGGYEFAPVGAENVRVRFADSGGGITLTIHDPDVVLSASKKIG